MVYCYTDNSPAARIFPICNFQYIHKLASLVYCGLTHFADQFICFFRELECTSRLLLDLKKEKILYTQQCIIYCSSVCYLIRANKEMCSPTSPQYTCFNLLGTKSMMRLFGPQKQFPDQVWWTLDHATDDLYISNMASGKKSDQNLYKQLACSLVLRIKLKVTADYLYREAFLENRAGRLLCRICMFYIG